MWWDQLKKAKHLDERKVSWRREKHLYEQSRGRLVFQKLGMTR
jgi:hypothetical protein